MREYEDFLRWRAQEELRSLGMSMADRAQRAGIDEEQLEQSLQDNRRAIYSERS
jgi:lambda repressor-like predicted transcriptional regulator